jgi:hypothetical protein
MSISAKFIQNTLHFIIFQKKIDTFLQILFKIWPLYPFQNSASFETTYGQIWPFVIFQDLATLPSSL